MTRSTWLLLLGLGCTPSLQILLPAAALELDQSQVEVVLPVDKQEVDVVFTLKNVSNSPVTILEVKPECDCAQTAISARTIASGQSGSVTLKFRSKLRNGTDILRAAVITDANEVYPISVTARLQSCIEVFPRTLFWKKGDAREPKEFLVGSTGAGKLRFTKVAAVKDSKAEFWPGKNPETIRVLVNPPAGDRPFQDTVIVSAVLEGSGETKIYDLHVQGE